MKMLKGIRGFFNDDNITETAILDNDLCVFIDGFSTKTIEDVQKDLMYYNDNLSFETEMINYHQAVINVKYTEKTSSYHKLLINSF